jgi:hypothetical protein
LTIALGCPVAAAVVDAADNDELCDHGECDEDDSTPRTLTCGGRVDELLHRQLLWRGGCSFDSAIACATSLSLIWRKRHVSHTKGAAESSSTSPDPTATIHSPVVNVAIIDIALIH